MSSASKHRGRAAGRSRGVALVAVLYFLVLAALTSIAVVFGVRAATRRTSDMRSDAVLIAAGDAAVHRALAAWNAPERAAQSIGSTAVSPISVLNGIDGTLSLTRLGFRIFSIVADVRAGARGAARRIVLLVRVPFPEPPVSTALLSAVDVSIGDGVRILASDSGACADSAAAGLTIAPGAALTIDSVLAGGATPEVRVDSVALDSAAFLRVSSIWWDELARRADVRLAPDAEISPAPVLTDSGCGNGPGNWGDPVDTTSACRARAPVVYVPGDLTIAGGRGQGVLLVDGRLAITGPFVYSGQIVVRHGIETRADAISISGLVSAWRMPSESTHTHASRSDVVLTHETTLRFSRCDAAHGMASWLQPRAVRAHAWSELF